MLETVGRERNAAIKRCHQLEAELREAQKRGRQLEMELLKAHSVEISPRMYRLVLSLLHPDRVVDPAAKEYLHGAFVQFTDQVEKAGRDNLSSMEETMRRRARTAAENRARG